MKDKKKISIAIVGILLCLGVIIGVSYALWMITRAQESTNTITTDCFKINFTDKNPISLSKAFPMTDSEGKQLQPYTFTIENVCDSSVKYQINLETIEQASGSKVLPDQYVKANLSEENANKILTKLDKEENPNLDTNTTIKNAIEAYKLYTGIIGPRETKTFNVRLWMDEGVTIESEDAMGANFEGKVSIIASYFQDNRGTLMATSETEAFWNYKEKILKVVFENELSPKETTLSWDVSEEQDGSVMSYLVQSRTEEELNATLEEYIKIETGMTLEEYKQDCIEQGMTEEEFNKAMEELKGYFPTSTLYIQSEGGIKANPNSRALFSDFENLMDIEGLEYLDTSSVTDMSRMFRNCWNLISLDLSNFNTSSVTDMHQMFSKAYDTGGSMSLRNLDLSNFDTSNVTNMSSMFYGCGNLISLDLSGFDTSNVTNMYNMFNGCVDLTSLNLSSFDTSKVTYMQHMFYNCNSLTSLDLRNFNTSNVTDMFDMFYSCNSLTSLDLSSFDTSKVTYMQHMFYNCRSLTSLNLSSFDTNNVTGMHYMFEDCISLTSVVYGENFVRKSGSNINSMYSNCPANKPTHSSWSGAF